MNNLITSLYPYLPMIFVVGLMLAAAKVVSILRQTDDSTGEPQGTSPAMIIIMAVLFLALLLLANSMTGGRVMALLGVIIRNPLALPMIGMFAVKRFHSRDGKSTVIYESDRYSCAYDYMMSHATDLFGNRPTAIDRYEYLVSVTGNEIPNYSISYWIEKDGERYALPLSLQELADDLSEEFNEKFYCKRAQHTDLLYLYTYIDKWSDADKECCVDYAKKYGREIGSTNICASERQTWDNVEYTPCLMVQMFVSPLTADELESLPDGAM